MASMACRAIVLSYTCPRAIRICMASIRNITRITLSSTYPGTRTCIYAPTVHACETPLPFFISVIVHNLTYLCSLARFTVVGIGVCYMCTQQVYRNEGVRGRLVGTWHYVACRMGSAHGRTRALSHTLRTPPLICFVLTQDCLSMTHSHARN